MSDDEEEEGDSDAVIVSEVEMSAEDSDISTYSLTSPASSRTSPMSTGDGEQKSMVSKNPRMMLHSQIQ